MSDKKIRVCNFCEEEVTPVTGYRFRLTLTDDDSGAGSETEVIDYHQDCLPELFNALVNKRSNRLDQR